MFTTLIVQPIFNILALIYSLIPGHNLGLSIIIFTIVVRVAMWPLIKKQVRNTKVMREIQPELKKIKARAKGDRSKETMLMMELYKERGISPFSQIGLIFVQMPILFGLYIGLNKLIHNPSQMVNFSYSFLHGFGGLKELVSDIGKINFNFLGIDLRLPPNIETGGVRFSAMIIVVAGAIAQYISAKQLMPNDKDAKSVKQILRDSKTGAQPDSSEMNAAVSRLTIYIIPMIILLVGMNIAAGLSLYILVGAVIAIIQQGIILREDETDLLKTANKKTNTKTTARVVEKKTLEEIVEAEVIKKPAKKQTKKAKKRR